MGAELTPRNVLAWAIKDPEWGRAAVAKAKAAKLYRDSPLAFVRDGWPWGQPGTLCATMSGPDPVQTEILEKVEELLRERGPFDGVNPVRPIRLAIASGHGIGKSTVMAWLVNWILATRRDSIGTITANTGHQLKHKTWAAITRWFAACRFMPAADWEINQTELYRKTDRAGWKVTAQTCAEENSQAFAGQHARGGTSFYGIDEGSAVPDKIYEVAEGGLVTGEPMIFVFGNMTQNTGKFHRIVVGKDRNRWASMSIDSRRSTLTNKKELQEWIDDNGIDSDFVRVRVLGLPPSQDDIQFIDLQRIREAKRRAVNELADTPLVAGVDIARGGDDENVIRFRRGLDARTIPPIRIPGHKTRDSMVMVDKLAEILSDNRPDRQVSMMFIDQGMAGGPIYDRLVQLGYRNIQQVNFGSAAPEDRRYANMRAWMWAKMRDWLLVGSTEDSLDLETDLSGPGYKTDKSDRLVLESKEDMAKRGLASPDDGDALALTFARPVAPPRKSSKPAWEPASPWS